MTVSRATTDHPARRPNCRVRILAGFAGLLRFVRRGRQDAMGANGGTAPTFDTAPRICPSTLTAGEALAARLPAGDVPSRVRPSTLLGTSDEPAPALRPSIARLSAIVLLCGLCIGPFARDSIATTAELMETARGLLARGDPTGATPLLRKVLAREPGHRDAAELLGDALLRTGAFADAEETYRTLQSQPGSAAKARIGLARSLFERGRHLEALKSLEAETVDADLGAEGALLRGRVLHALRRTEEARAQFSAARDALPARADAELARLLMTEVRHDEASALLRDSLAQHPRSVDLWLARGDFLLKVKGERALALDDYRKASESDPDSVAALISSGQMMLALGRLDAAKDVLVKARAKAPLHFQVAFLAALVAYKEGKFSEGMMLLATVQQSMPDHTATTVLAGSLSLALGDLETARAAYVYFLRKFPGDLSARKMLAVTLLRLDQPDAAAGVLWPFVKLPIVDAEFLSVAGTALLKLRETEAAVAVFERAVALAPHDAVLLARLGAAYEAHGRFEDAQRVLDRAISLAPETPEPRRQLVRLYLNQGRFQDALAAGNALSARHPNMPAAYWLTGLAHKGAGDSAQAEQAFKTAAAVDARYFPAVAALAHADMVRSGKPAARVRFERFLAGNPGHLDAQMAIAELDADDGKLAQAIDQLERLAADHPRSSSAHMLLSNLQLRARRYSQAAYTATRGRKLEPRDPAMTETLGRAKMAARDYAGAATAFTALVQLDPRYAEGYAQLAAAHRASGELRSAIVTLQQGLARHPENLALAAMLGRLYVDTKGYDQALKLAAQAASVQPRSGLGPAIEGDVHLAQSNPQQAIEAYRRADRIRPDASHRIRIHQAQSLHLAQEAPAESLRQSIAQFPNHLPLRLYTADVLVRLGEPAAAIALYEKALESDPDNAAILNNLADALIKQGDARALAVAQQAFTAAPESAAATATLGTALLGAGKVGEALALLRKAVDLDDNHFELRIELVRALAKAKDYEGARKQIELALKRSKRPQDEATARALAADLDKARSS